MVQEKLEYFQVAVGWDEMTDRAMQVHKGWRVARRRVCKHLLVCKRDSYLQTSSLTLALTLTLGTNLTEH